MSQTVYCVGRRHLIEDALHGVPECFLRSGGQASQQLLDLAEDHLDGIQIRAVWRQVMQFGLRAFNPFTNPRPFMAREVIQDHDVAGFQYRHEHLFDKRLEHLGVHAAVDYGGTGHTLASQRRDQGGGFPVPVRCLGMQTFAARRSAAKTRHIRGRPRFIDEDQSGRRDRPGPQAPVLTALNDIRAILLGRVQRFF